MKSYYNPEMTITNFYIEDVATTPSSVLEEWKEQQSSASRSTSNVDFSKMTIVDTSF